MGKTTGFLEFNRQLPAKKNVSERVKNYNEFVSLFEPAILNNQAARCMDCGIPFCHNGCPLGNVIPEFNDAVYKENWLEAYQILTSTNNFPEFTGRICPAPCEAACVLGINQPPITIEEIEKNIIEIAFQKNFVKAKKKSIQTNYKIAVVGSGPAGLAAADQLSSVGHAVTVFERDPAPGGLLRFGIPDFKLEKNIVERRINLMKEAGVEFRCNTNIGVNYSASQLKREFDAIILSGGSTIPRDLKIAGREINGVYFAMQFLKQQNKRVSNFTIEEPPIIATNKHVIVIGGGDTGSDCVGTSNRQGALSVTQFELLPEPPKERNLSMPWPTYPMLFKNTSSHEEGVNRIFAVATKEFIADENGNLKSIKIVDLAWNYLPDGKIDGFKEVTNSEREIPCQLALLAMGFMYPQQQGLLQELGVELDNKGNVLAAEFNYQTNIKKIFTAGDMRRGQSLVVWAISEGRECAKKVDEYLMGHSYLPSKESDVRLN